MDKWYVESLGYIVKRYVDKYDEYEYVTNEKGETLIFEDYYSAEFHANYLNSKQNKVKK